jgi:hypothetical protein
VVLTIQFPDQIAERACAPIEKRRSMPLQVNTESRPELEPRHFPAQAAELNAVFAPGLSLKRGTLVAPGEDGLMRAREPGGAACGILKVDLKTTARGAHLYGRHYDSDAPQHGAMASTLPNSAPVFVAGVFDPGQLIGLDEAAVRALNGRMLFDGSFRF